MSRGESSSSNATIGSPVKALKRDVRGLLSLQQESPSQSDVLWSSLDSPHKTRTVGGKSKTLKSSNQLTPKNNAIRKKYYSSPILVARVPDENNDEIKKLKVLENQRILEEFHRQFSNESYVPRNLLDNLENENLDDSIVAPDDKINKQDSDIIKDEIDKLTDYNLTDQEDFEALAEMEEQARKFLDKKESQKTTNVASNKPAAVISASAPSVTKPATLVSKPAPLISKPAPLLSKPAPLVSKPTPLVPKLDPSVSKPAPSKLFNFKNPKTAPTTSKEKKNDYFDSDDDDIILSIPLEKLSAETSKPATISNNKKEPPVKATNNFSHTSVIPTKRENINVSSDKNRIQNQSNSKLFVQSKSVTDNATSEPLAKRRCTPEEIAEKRRLAMQRREAYLQSLKVTQKPKN